MLKAARRVCAARNTEQIICLRVFAKNNDIAEPGRQIRYQRSLYISGLRNASGPGVNTCEG